MNMCMISIVISISMITVAIIIISMFIIMMVATRSRPEVLK